MFISTGSALAAIVAGVCALVLINIQEKSVEKEQKEFDFEN